VHEADVPSPCSQWMSQILAPSLATFEANSSRSEIRALKGVRRVFDGCGGCNGVFEKVVGVLMSGSEMDGDVVRHATDPLG